MNKGFLKDTIIKVTEGKIINEYNFTNNKCVKITLEDGAQFICGQDQLLFSNNEWVPANESLYRKLSNGKEVTDVLFLNETYDLYDITVSNEEHSYYIVVNGEEIKVHNLYNMSINLGGGSSVRPVAKPPVTSTSTSQTQEDTTIYIPETIIQFTVSMLKPNTKLYAFFDGKDVTSYVQPTGGNFGDTLITDSTGYASGNFKIPNNNTIKFIAGQRELVLTDSSTNTNPTTYATATYIYTGTTDNPNNPNLDSSSTTEERNIAPLIQSFYCGEKGGMFVSKIGLFFYAKDPTQSILFQIREVKEDKVLSNYIAGTSITINPSDIIESTDSLNPTPTWIELPNPIYLTEGNEYAIFLVTNSSNYIMHMVDYGQQTNNVTATKDISSRSIIKYAGSNNWVRDNSRGLKYIIQKCKFDTANSYTLSLGNVNLGERLLPDNSLSVKANSNVITVTDPNHSFSVDGFVTISGLPAGTYAGIPSTQINGVHKITEVTWNTYSFDNYWDGGNYENSNQLPNADIDLIFGTNVTTDYDYQYDKLVLNMNSILLTGSSLNYQIKTQSGQSLDGSEQPYIMDTTSNNIVPQIIYTPTKVRKVSSLRNSDKFSVPNYKSMQVVATFKSDNENVSPMIDKYNMNAILVENLINNKNSTEFINVLNLKGSVNNFSDLPSDDNNIGDKYIVLNTNTSYVWDGTAWIAEGEACARKIWKTVNLYEQGTGLKVTFYGAVQANSSVSVYYKTLGVSESVSIDSKDWNKMELEREVTKSLNETDYQQYNYMVDNLDPFKSFKVKVVMNSSDSTKVPLLKKFAAIAFAA